ncbi:MAG: hypothetical protein R2939_11080 [Kofleriaceae bacterium]
MQALAFAGDVDGAVAVATSWRERDALDPEALDYLADLQGRRGQRDLALRSLGGTVDLDPDRIERHERLAEALTAAGRLRQACAHRLAIASLASTEPGRAADAMRCARALGQGGDASRIARALPSDKARLAAEKLVGASAPAATPRGDLVVRATWQDGGELDLSIVTGSGRRWSWQGGRSGLAVDGALDRATEVLAVRKLPRGSYRIAVRRPAGAPAGIARGTVEIVALGERRTLPFELVGERVVVGDVKVRLESQLVPYQGPTPSVRPPPVTPRRPEPSIFE